jgi:hypothetical protein
VKGGEVQEIGSHGIDGRDACRCFVAFVFLDFGPDGSALGPHDGQSAPEIAARKKATQNVENPPVQANRRHEWHLPVARLLGDPDLFFDS